MKNRVAIAILCTISSGICAEVMINNKLDLLELDAQKAMQRFNDLHSTMNISALSESIVSYNTQMLEKSLNDLVSLNKTVNTQVNTAIQFWNMYVDTVKAPTIDTYLLGQVMNTLIGTIRALSLRSSVDQAMILSFIKTHFNDAPTASTASAVEAESAVVEDRWKAMHIQ